MTNKPFKDYTAVSNGTRSLREAIAEIDRELGVRRKIFDRWVLEGKMPWMDAHDRMERILSALKFLIAYDQQIDAETIEQINTAFQEPSLLTPKQLDDVAPFEPA